jgi:hypothetical protein
MREREAKLGWEDHRPKDKRFVRRKIVGSFKDKVPEAVLKTFTKVSMPAFEAA